MSRIALFGGTFNPFHIGHLEILEALCEQDNIDKVFVMPDSIPPHKKCDFLAEDADRIEMCRLMCNRFQKADICLVEFEREGKSYTYDTVMELKKKYPNDSFSVVCGGDMISSLHTWYNYDLLKKEVSFIAFNRNNDSLFLENIQKLTRDGALISIIDKEITNVSSTEIRCNLSKVLLPKEIYDYITEKGIYNV